MSNNVFPINGKTKLEQNIVGSEEILIGILPRQKQRVVLNTHNLQVTI